jgi:hypothetical protein
MESQNPRVIRMRDRPCGFVYRPPVGGRASIVAPLEAPLHDRSLILTMQGFAVSMSR